MMEREVLQEIVCKVGVLTYGKERWFKQNGCWYDRMNGDYIQNETLAERICKELEAEIEDEPQTETKMKTQNSNLTFEKRTMRDCYNCKRYETEEECIECHYEPKDEPQTDCSWRKPND